MQPARNQFADAAHAPQTDAEYIQRDGEIERQTEAARRRHEPSEPPLPAFAVRPPLHITPPPPLRVACPQCHAPAGQKCAYPGGMPLTGYHRARRDAAAPRQEPAPPSAPPQPAPAPERETRKLASPEHLQAALVDLLNAYPVFTVLDAVWVADRARHASA
jgi:hypothetical protein